MPKQQFQALFFIIRRIAYLAWLFYMQWGHTTLLLFDWSKLDDKRSEQSNGGSNEFIWWLIKLNTLKKVHDASLQNLSIIFTFISKGGNRSNGGSNEFIWWLIKPDSLKKVCDTSFVEPFHWFYIHVKMWQQNKDRRGLHEEANLQTKPPRNSCLPLWPLDYMQEAHYTTFDASDG